MWNLIEVVVSSCFFICFLVRNIDTCKFVTSLQYTFPVWKCMIRLRICAHFSLYHIIWFGINMTPMWHHCIFICFIYVMCFLTRPSVLRIYLPILSPDAITVATSNKKMSARYKVMCGCECFIYSKYIQSSLLSWCDRCLKIM